MERSPIAFRLKCGTQVEIHEGGTTIIFSDGTFVEGAPQGSPEQAATAERMGTTPEQMCRDHDPLHAILACALGQPCSYALYRVANDLPETPQAKFEEAAVLALQAYIVALGLDAPELAKRLNLILP